MAGLGAQASGTGWAGNFVIVDPRLTAPRGEQFSASYVPPDEDGGIAGDTDFQGQNGADYGVWSAPAEVAIPDDNVGFKMLQKMGWSQGKGLGRNEDGIVEPIRAGVDAGVRLGLGKQEEDNFFTDADGVRRKRTEAELQANEDPERARKREIQVERDQRIKEDVTQILRTFYCEVCDKQYTTAMALEEHLSSYDHGHRKRLKEMQAQTAERTRGERMKREQKQMDREAARLNEQFQRAQQRTAATAAAATAAAAPTHPLPPSVGALPPLPTEPSPPLPPSSSGAPPLPPPAPPLPPGPAPLVYGGSTAPGSSPPAPSFGISFGLGGGGRGGVMGRGPGGRGVAGAAGGIRRVGGPAGAAAGKAGGKLAVGALAGFGADSDSDG